VRFYMINLGCPKNAVDAEGMTLRLVSAGHRPAPSAEQADLLLVNTCGFIAAARAESLATLRELAAGKRRRQILIATGCLAEREGAGLAARVPGLDAYLGTRHWSQIVPLVEEVVQRRGHKLVALRHECAPGGETSPLLVAAMERRAQGPSAYVKIADGCDARCAFCAIPQIKGPQHSKPRAEVVAEARSLVAQGVRELILIAQDTTAYGQDLGDAEGLATLLPELLAATPELNWLRLMYSYPQHITPRLIEVLAADARICHYVDLPLQHAHPGLLRRMNRPHDPERIVRLLADLRAALPDVALRTTFIVGFPGETEAEFQALLDFMVAIRFDRVGIFTYSKEKGTPAAGMPDQVPPQVRQERYDRAMTLQQEISLARNKEQIGRTLPVLVEGTQEGVSVGRSYRDAPEIDGLVLVQGAQPSGQFTNVEITGALEYDLLARAETGESS
jgi:ribosomal protein S12 methylthiotransferase